MQTVLIALVDAINSPTRAAPLGILARIKYPGREIQPFGQSDGTIALTLPKSGFEYKHRGPRPPSPPKADTEGIRQVLAAALAPGYTVCAVNDHAETITIIVQEEHQQ